MNTRDDYINKMKLKIDEWNENISKLESRVLSVEASLQREYMDQISLLKKKRDEAFTKLNELKTSSESAWQDLKSGVDLAWESVSSAMESATARFSKIQEPSQDREAQ